MVLSVPISASVEATLAAKARSAGVDVPTYAATLLEQTAKAPLTLKEISVPSPMTSPTAA